MRNRRDVEQRKLILQTVKASVITKWTLYNEGFLRINIAFQNNLSVCWNLHVNSTTLNQLNPLAPQKTTKKTLVGIGRQGSNTHKGINRIPSQSNRNWHTFTTPFVLEIMLAAIMMRMPVHARCIPVFQL